MRSTLPLTALGFLFALTVTGQKRPPAAPSTGGGSSPGLTLPTQPPQNQPDQSPESQTPIFLSGTVVIEGDGAPAANVAVKRVCGNTPRTMAWTNARGQFSFQWNSPASVVAEASDSGPYRSGPNSANSSRSVSATVTGSRTSTNNLPGVDMLGCELRVDAPGFNSDRIELTGHRAMDNPDLGTILLHRIGKGEGTSVSATTLIAPQDARKAWEKGVQLLRAAQPTDPGAAEKEFERAVRIYPRYAEAWLDLGRALQSQQKEERARDAFLKAVDADGKRAEPLIELGLIASRRQQWPEAARYLDRALQLDPVDYPHLWYDDAEADYHVRNLERAERNVREVLKMAPPNREMRAQRLLGLVLIGKQDYAGAAAALLAYLRESPDVEDWDELHAKLGEIRDHLQAQP